MGLINEGIDRVRVFEFSAQQRVCLVKWQSSWTDKVYQVYAGGKFAGATKDVEQRQIVIPTTGCDIRAARIEVFAVTPMEANIDYSAELEEGLSDTGRVKLSFQKQASDVRFEVYYDNATGTIDYENKIGDGPTGADSTEIIEWVSPAMEAGLYKFAIKAFDGNGNERIALETQEITVIPAAKPARSLSVLSFDESINELILKVTE